MATILLCILAFILPPLPVAILKGIDEKFLICLLLTLLGFFPGLIYALWVIFSHQE